MTESSFDRKYSLLIKEWEQCESSIARYDTIVFAIRGWAVSTFAAILAASVGLKEPSLITFAIVPTLSFWIIDALNKSFQHLFVLRVRKIEKYLRSPLFKEDEKAQVIFFETPSIAGDFEEDGKKHPNDKLRIILRCAWWDNVRFVYLGMLAACILGWPVLKLFKDREQHHKNKRQSYHDKG
jgi:hypothetical protein